MFDGRVPLAHDICPCLGEVYLKDASYAGVLKDMLGFWGGNTKQKYF